MSAATTSVPLADGSSVLKKKTAVPPMNMVYRFMTEGRRVQVWLYERPETRLEGLLKGFDEYLNVVLDECEEVNRKKGERKVLGRILLKGDNITLIRALPKENEETMNQ